MPVEICVGNGIINPEGNDRVVNNQNRKLLMYIGRCIANVLHGNQFQMHYKP